VIAAASRERSMLAVKWTARGSQAGCSGMDRGRGRSGDRSEAVRKMDGSRGDFSRMSAIGAISRVGEGIRGPAGRPSPGTLDLEQIRRLRGVTAGLNASVEAARA